MQSIKIDLSASEVRNFGLITLGGFAVLGAILWYQGRSPESVLGWAGGWQQQAAVGFWIVGLAFAGICVASHKVGLKLYTGWMTAAMYMGAVMTTVILSVLFIVLLPIFSLIRLKDPLRYKLGGTDSYWEDHEPHPATLERTARPF